MEISTFELFRIGIGPSSSHTVGPMRAAGRFAGHLEAEGLLARIVRVTVTLYGSLAATGKGHGTDKALTLGLLGEDPERVDPDQIPELLKEVEESSELILAGSRRIAFNPREDLDFKRYKPLPAHPNGMIFHAFGEDDEVLLEETVYSIGGGFLASPEELAEEGSHPPVPARDLPYPFASGDELIAHAERENLRISDIMLANECVLRPEAEVWERLGVLWQAMQDCVQRGCRTEGSLPGGLKVGRRAPALFHKLCDHPEASLRDPLAIIDWVNLYALAVNEENAAGGRVVTAPTNGAAGIIPAVLHYAVRFTDPHKFGNSVDNDHAPERFLLTAAAIGALYKKNASISGADVGCQGEVGSACSMAAGALAEWLGGTPSQVENAAEIGMEHNLGLTCDPIGGLVQIPCIERNAMGSVKALNAARMALRGDGSHYVSLDKVIKTMKETGRDMKSKYKETSRGGLAVNVIEC